MKPPNAIDDLIAAQASAYGDIEAARVVDKLYTCLLPSRLEFHEIFAKERPETGWR